MWESCPATPSPWSPGVGTQTVLTAQRYCQDLNIGVSRKMAIMTVRIEFLLTNYHKLIEIETIRCSGHSAEAVANPPFRPPHHGIGNPQSLTSILIMESVILDPHP